MKSILLKLYDGEICPAQDFWPKLKKYYDMKSKYFQKHTQFEEKLKETDPCLHEDFVEIIDGHFDEVPLKLAETFIDGFRLGVKMMVEVYQGEYSEEE